MVDIRDLGVEDIEVVNDDLGAEMLVVDYTGGEPLDRMVRQPMEIGAFLRNVAPLSGAVGQLHGRGRRPANVTSPVLRYLRPTQETVQSISALLTSPRKLKQLIRDVDRAWIR